MEVVLHTDSVLLHTDSVLLRTNVMHRGALRETDGLTFGQRL